MTTDQHDTSDRRCSCGELLTCLAATPAPLDEDWKALYDNAVERVNALWYAAQPIIDAAIDIFPEEWVDPESSMAMPVTLRGRDVFALRAALKETP